MPTLRLPGLTDVHVHLRSSYERRKTSLPARSLRGRRHNHRAGYAKRNRRRLRQSISVKGCWLRKDRL